MKIKSVEKIATVYYYVDTDDELFPNYRRSESGQWEHSMGESWEVGYDDGTLEKAFQEYQAGQPTFRLEYFQPRSLLENGVYYIEYIDDHQVRLTKKASS